MKSKLCIQKYGGTSLENTDLIKKVANRIKKYYNKGDQIVVVVSAMGGTTDNLIHMARNLNIAPSPREMDMLLSTGEQISISLLAMALDHIGVPAISFIASQIDILTDGNFNNARIIKIDTKRIKENLKEGNVCIVAGFQGIDHEKNITTLGRGGSDTSGVALAAALGSYQCEIFTDVDGIFTADPRYVPEARKLNEVSYDEMLELSSLGAGILHSRSVEFAKKYGVTLHVRSSFNNKKGTLVVPEEKKMEKLLVTGVTLKQDESRISVNHIPDKPGIAAELFKDLARDQIIVDMIVQSTGSDKMNTISFTVPEESADRSATIIKKLLQKWGTGFVNIDGSIAIVSAVGVGMKSHVGVAAKMFEVLADNGINIEMISTSEIKISCVINRNKSKKAVKLIHDTFLIL